MKTKELWKKLNDNEVLSRKDYYISYNPNTSASKSGLGEIYNMLGALAGSVMGRELEIDGRAETALCLREGSKFYILNGDFRKDYEKLKTFTACLKFYNSKPEFHSNWSIE